MVRFALLLHDVGKGLLPGDHVNGSLEAAQGISEQNCERPKKPNASRSS